MSQSPGNAEVRPPGPPIPPEAPVPAAIPMAGEAAVPPPEPAAEPPVTSPNGECLMELMPAVPSWLASLVFHLLLVLLLATWGVIQRQPGSGTSLIVSSGGSSPDAGTEADELAAATAILSTEPAPDAEALESTAIEDIPDVPFDPGPLLADLPALGDAIGGEGGRAGPDLAPGQGFGLRTDAELRHSLVISAGGTPESEAAVAAALAWLAAHQLADGRWSFQHSQHANCKGQCGNDGNHNADIAATSLALLPFLGAGQTHLKGQYREQIRRGLEWLVNSIKREDDLGSLWQPQGTMYGHGLASIVLCEAFGMTGDRWLYRPAQSVINFIVDAQDPDGGGWRYVPRMRGDTSVVGWQLMALKSAHMAELRVPPGVFRKTSHFLDTVAVNYGAGYGYDSPRSNARATSAVGLLCRMYLGWGHRTRALRQGVNALDKLGPSIDTTPMRNNLYYNYYATQVMRHWGGAPWRDWNAVMRDYLVKTQSHEGHSSGSWYFDGDQGSGPGGRLYCTAMSAMILEVYYRHLPLYGERSLRQ